MAVKTESKKLILESTTLWDFPRQNYGDRPHGDNKFNGVTPAFIIWNLLQRYTKKGDLVVDPMCGSGTTIDVCKEEGRKVIGYDIAPRRKGIIKNDARKIPLEDNSADFFFIDSPYSDNISYSNNPKCIGKISCEKEDFFVALDTVAKEIHRVLKPTKAMAWLIGDQCKKKTFVPVGFKLYEILAKYLRPIDLVCISRHNQTSNTPIWHERARMYNFYLRGFKYLLIMSKAH
ncbi:MAG: methyltransferase domain-containing protein [Candidatus Omnitrophica bacterium]|nr:methyltransferase domain-containing protein [Candidatus Omnitrophota bacterium]